MNLRLTINRIESELLKNVNDLKLSSVLWNGIFDQMLSKATEYFQRLHFLQSPHCSLCKKGHFEHQRTAELSGRHVDLVLTFPFLCKAAGSGTESSIKGIFGTQENKRFSICSYEMFDSDCSEK